MKPVHSIVVGMEVLCGGLPDHILISLDLFLLGFVKDVIYVPLSQSNQISWYNIGERIVPELFRAPLEKSGRRWKIYFTLHWPLMKLMSNFYSF